MKKHLLFISLMPIIFCSAHAQETYSRFTERRIYLREHLNVTDDQLKELEKLHETFDAFIKSNKNDSTLTSNDKIYLLQQIIIRQDRELRSILTEKQFLQLKTDQENAQKAALQNYYKELEKERLLQQKKANVK